MRNSVAKRLRKQAYKEVEPDQAAYTRNHKGTIYCGNPRKEYLRLKGDHNKTEIVVKVRASKRQKREAPKRIAAKVANRLTQQ